MLALTCLAIVCEFLQISSIVASLQGPSITFVDTVPFNAHFTGDGSQYFHQRGQTRQLLSGGIFSICEESSVSFLPQEIF